MNTSPAAADNKDYVITVAENLPCKTKNLRYNEVFMITVAENLPRKTIIVTDSLWVTNNRELLFAGIIAFYHRKI
jgi:hypothetical protein